MGCTSSQPRSLPQFYGDSQQDLQQQVRVQTSVPYLPEKHAESETAAGDGTGHSGLRSDPPCRSLRTRRRWRSGFSRTDQSASHSTHLPCSSTWEGRAIHSPSSAVPAALTMVFSLWALECTQLGLLTGGNPIGSLRIPGAQVGARPVIIGFTVALGCVESI